MGFARFFDRVYAAAGGHLSVSRQSLEDSLGSRSVGVVCGKETMQEGNDRWIAEMVVNLLARFYPRIAIKAEDGTLDFLRTLALSINPLITVDENWEAVAATVLIGTATAPNPCTLSPRAEGWVARLTRRTVPGTPGPANPYAAGVAGGLAVSEVFRQLFCGGRQDFDDCADVNVSLLDYTENAGHDAGLPVASLGEVAFVGLGAVGNSALWALAKHEGLTGDLWTVDPEDIELSNLQRYVLTVDTDVGKDKQSVAEKALKGTALSIHPRRESLEAYASSLGGAFNIPTICVSVDNVEGRRTAQALLPRLVVNGWTSDSGLGASWHLFNRDAACLACLHHPQGPSPSQTEIVARALGLSPEKATMLWVSEMPLSHEHVVEIAQNLGVRPEGLALWERHCLRELYSSVACGAVPLDIQGVGKVESVPLAHQSALAGLLMSAELVKRVVPDLASASQPDTLVAWQDILRAPPSKWTQPRAREPGCICSDPVFQKAYAEKWFGYVPQAINLPS